MQFFSKRTHLCMLVTLTLCLCSMTIHPDNETNKKRILISGAAGFIGSTLAKKLIAHGHSVVGLDNLICGNINNLQSILDHPNFKFFRHDVCKPFDYEKEIDIIVHLASVPSPAFYYTLPLETFNTGIQGTQNLLKLAVEKHARFFFSSTSEVYGDPEISPQPEHYNGNVSTIGPRAQYDESKRAAETLIKIYHEHYGLDVRIARIFNTYGPYMRLDDGRVVTNFIRAVFENKPIPIYGSGKQTRSFAYIEDTINGILTLIFTDQIDAETSIADRIFNIGSLEEYTIEQLAHKINALSEKYLQRTVPLEFQDERDSDDPKIRRPDLKKSKTHLAYTPTTSLDQGLEKTFLFYLELHRQLSPTQTLAQIPYAHFCCQF